MNKIKNNETYKDKIDIKALNKSIHPHCFSLFSFLVSYHFRYILFLLLHFTTSTSTTKQSIYIYIKF